MYNRIIKRAIDFILSFLAICILSPLLLILYVLVRIKLGSPAVFRQERPGLHGRIFTLYKFRTMTDEKDSEGNLLPDEIRLTVFGKFLRSTSLDELPELINIVKGNMAIIGPRPLLVEYLTLYNEEQQHRHDVRPGLTGLAQIRGRNAVTWEQRSANDLEYVKKISFWFDLRILFLTVGKVLKREGINSETAATMERFTGTLESREKDNDFTDDSFSR